MIDGQLHLLAVVPKATCAGWNRSCDEVAQVSLIGVALKAQERLLRAAWNATTISDLLLSLSLGKEVKYAYKPRGRQRAAPDRGTPIWARFISSKLTLGMLGKVAFQ
jgi:hypothetical protein